MAKKKQIQVQRTNRKIFNPVAGPGKTNEQAVRYTVINYNDTNCSEWVGYNTAPEWGPFLQQENLWVDLDGLDKKGTEAIAAAFNIHFLHVEDIINVGQRAKIDETVDKIFCLLPYVAYNIDIQTIEIEQVSIVLGKNLVISFQQDARLDIFAAFRSRLKSSTQRVSERGADYLCYCLIDVVIDNYFNVLEKLIVKVEQVEDRIMEALEQDSLAEISHVRKEVLLFKRLLGPVREMVNGFLRSDHELIKERNEKYYKDVYDHIIQANESVDTLRDQLSNLQDLYMNKINLRMNEVMKIFTMVSLLLAPATVIGGIFGMNFSRIPLLQNQLGFYISVAAMLIIPVLMLVYFKKKKWF